MEIRKIQKNDLISCSIILKNEYSKPPYNENFIDNNELEYIKSKYKINKENSFVILKDNKIIWFCFCNVWYWSNWLQWIIEEIVIDWEFQSKWIWKILYNHIQKYLENLWVKSIMLWCQNDANAYNFQKNWYILSQEHSILFKNF